MPYTQQFEVLAHDCDAKDNARPTAIIRYMQETADHQMRDQKPSYAELFANHKAFILSKMSVRILSPLYMYDVLTVSSWPVNPKGVIFMRYYTIDRQGVRVAEGVACWALIDTLSKRFLRGSDIEYSNYSKQAPLVNTTLERVSIDADSVMSKVGQRRICYADVDRNGHMNNTNYADMLCGFVPNMARRNLISFSIHYIKEAPLDAVLDIYLSAPQPTNDNSTIYMARTLIGAEVNCEAQIVVDNCVQ